MTRTTHLPAALAALPLALLLALSAPSLDRADASGNDTATAEVAKKKRKLCCTVRHSGNVAVVSGSIRLPRGAELIHVGMDPPVGACAVRGSSGTVTVSKRLDLRRVERGRYRFVYMYRLRGKLVDKQTASVLVKGKREAQPAG